MRTLRGRAHFLLPLALMLSWLGAEELLAMLNKRGTIPAGLGVYAGALLTVVLSGMPIFWPEASEQCVRSARSGWLTIGLVSGFIIGALR